MINKKIELKINSAFDSRYNQYKEKLKSMESKDIEFIYDVAKRLINKHGHGMTFTEKLYLIGYIDGIESKHNT